MLEEFTNSFAEVKLLKGESLLRINQVCRHMYIVKKGAVRHFRIAKDGSEYNTWFSFEDDIIAVLKSTVRESPSNTGIIAMEDTTFLSISQSEIDNLRIKHHSFETFSRRLIEEYFIFMEQRAFSAQANTALQKYAELLSANPKVMDRVTQTQIASYLGIKKETFTRIKKKMKNLSSS
ncbi:Crp/Fnr family transcriptional regulator [Portibacter lacus]|uniref:Crp/Fnr family transcriptional regulator n=1 Tax=Portibacter lacus TaxID=1099794 RepID=UPI0024E0E4AC|nr:Crp/Fnr family transcriptional regulator [Portibacter lacus]